MMMNPSWSCVIIVLLHVCRMIGGVDRAGSNNETAAKYGSVQNDHRLPPIACSPGQYWCNDDRGCVDESVLCDGDVRDCENGNGGCAHLCRKTAFGARCQCARGYRSVDQGRQCVIEDEHICADGRGPCHHYCRRHNADAASYNCSCAPGYSVQSDGRTCRLDRYANGLLYFSVGHQVRNLPFNSWRHLPTGRFAETGVMCDVRIGTVEGLDTNNANSYYYYTRNGGIYANNERETCLVHGLAESGTNVAIDWTTGNLYFVNGEPASLGVCRFDGRFCAVLFNEGDLGLPRGLVLHPKRGLMFWTDLSGNPKIERANMNGRNRVPIVQERLGWPNAVAIDYVHDVLYFADSKRNVIERCQFDGSNRQLVRSGVSHPFDMIVFDDHLYWSDWESNGIVTASVSNNNSDHRTLYRHPFARPYGIALFHSAYQQTDMEDPCESAGCSHICALTSGGVYDSEEVFASCLCPTGYVFRDDSKLECIPIRDDTSTTSGGPRWCLDVFVDACDTGDENPCENGGKCTVERDKYRTPMAATCTCPSNYAGLFCEVQMDIVEEEATSAAWFTAPLIVISIFLLATAVVIVLICRYGKYKNGKSHLLRWSHSVIFHEKLPHAARALRSGGKREITDSDHHGKNMIGVISFT